MTEIWGGIECTVNRVGDRYLDQVVRTGHHDRDQDLLDFAALGITAIRYPVLWERVAPEPRRPPSFTWTDERLGRLRALGIRPIVGLLHHGSGPRHTSLADPDFPARLADYAALVAERYSWITDWTPVNEPVTTARFSGLYGHWYPHQRSDAAFVRMTLNQVHGIAAAMSAIRAVIPGAQLVHTDDAGTVSATPPLTGQATFENLRRDLALDLLFGRVDSRHSMHAYLVANGATAAELDALRAHPCPPDTIGANYYVTSDRLLDDRLTLYPPDSHGGNGRQRYADIASVRATPPVLTGFAALLERVWRTYARPVALTEVHLACTREEQLRWLAEAWRGAAEATAAGIPVRALCAWSLLGAYDWNRLVTVEAGDYESGVFDVRAPTPRSTALFRAIRAMTQASQPAHPVLAQAGWWRGESRTDATIRSRQGRRLLLLGANGTLGSEFVRRCRARGIDALALGHHDVDVTRASDLGRAIGACRPWAVINASGFVDVDAAERHGDACMAVNAMGARLVAEACDRARAHLVTFSSDLVFDGLAVSPYLESSSVHPLNVYGRSKVELERSVLGALPTALVIRTSAFLDARDPRTFSVRVLDAAANGAPVETSGDIVSPTYIPALADAVLDLLIDEEQGLWHVSNAGAVSWTELARRLVIEAGGDPGLVREVGAGDLGRTAPRPAYSALSSERGQVMPTLDQSLECLFRDRASLLEHAAR